MPDAKPMSPERLAEIEEQYRYSFAVAVPELLAEVRRLQSAVDRLANAERDLAETNLVLEQQDRQLMKLLNERDRAMADAAEARFYMNDANDTADDASRHFNARIAALEAGLREALDLADVPDHHQGNAWCDAYAHLRDLADGVESKEST